MTKKLICKYYQYTDYYETECGNQIDYVNYEFTQPTFCPFCGGKIRIEK